MAIGSETGIWDGDRLNAPRAMKSSGNDSASLGSMLPLDPDAADRAPTDPAFALYNKEHLIAYLRLLDADAEESD